MGSIEIIGDWLQRISFMCFAASYVAALAFELARLFSDAKTNRWLTIGVTSAGVFAHTIYLFSLIGSEMSTNESRINPLASWYGWCLMACWVLAATNLFQLLFRRSSAFGIFILPLILILLGVAYEVQDVAPFAPDEAKSIWGAVHGVALLIGTVIVVLGFVAGLMYLIQSRRLKQKKLPYAWFPLPSLEWLQKTNQHALTLSSFSLAIGLLAGFAMNAIRRTVLWSDPVVISSSILLAWLVVSCLFEYYYRPARQGRKVAYLTVASFVFLIAVLLLVLWAQHAADPTASLMLRLGGTA